MFNFNIGVIAKFPTIGDKILQYSNAFNIKLKCIKSYICRNTEQDNVRKKDDYGGAALRQRPGTYWPFGRSIYSCRCLCAVSAQAWARRCIYLWLRRARNTDHHTS